MALAISFSLFFGCKKTEPEPSGNGILDLPVTERDGGALDSEDQRRSDFAKVFAKSLSDASFRAYLKNKYTQLQTTDKEFVYALFRNEVVSGSQTVHQLLASFADQDFTNLYGADFFNTVINVDPLLTIDFVEDETYTLNDWTTNTIPKVGVGTKKTISFIGQEAGYPGYDNSGNLIRFDDLDAPSSFSIWVKKSETLVAIHRTTKLTFEGEAVERILSGRRGLDGMPEFVVCEELWAQIQYIEQSYAPLSYDQWPTWILVEYDALQEQYFSLCVDPPSGGGDPCTEPCQRDCVVADETLVKFRITGWNAFNTIRNQPFESRYKFRCWVPIFNASNAPVAIIEIITNKYKKKDLLDCNPSPCVGKWLTMDQKMWKDWKLTEVRDIMQYLWFEDDDKTVTFSLSAGVVPKLKFKVGNVEVELSGPTFNIGLVQSFPAFLTLGTSEVFYCDPANSPGTTYSRPLYEMVVKHNN